MFYNGHVPLNWGGAGRKMSVYRVVYTCLKKYLASWDAQVLPRVGKNKEVFAVLPCHGEVALPEQSQKKPTLHITAVSWSIPTPWQKAREEVWRGKEKSERLLYKTILTSSMAAPTVLSSVSFFVFLSLSLSLPPISFIPLSSQLVFIECPENWERSQKTSLFLRHFLSSGVGASGHKYSVGWW